MEQQWFPQDKEELNNVLEKFLKEKSKASISNTHGLIVPHAGYEFSGKIAGKAFSLLKNSKKKKAIIIGPSHYMGFTGVKVLENIETPLGKIKLIPSNFNAIAFENIPHEHSVKNQVPFLQKLGFEEILPLVVGDVGNEEAKKIANYISEIKNAVYIFSTDLSHFNNYNKAVKKDRNSIKIIKDLDLQNWEKIDACGSSALLVLMHLCKLKNWKPKLIEYKNSGDVTEDKSSVVGYASFYF
ncbi:AmmeMemoRadiSam system protein B [Candidatus Pacearchaeota archaeon]|nr:AmmeMemoRadiSam system protein B [Candidatus Pacearchaeota archaeon]